MLLGIAVVAGLLGAAITGARWRALAEAEWRHPWLCAAAIVIQLGLFSGASWLAGPLLPIAPELHMLSLGLTVAFLAFNRRTPGIALMLLGATLNLVVIASNGGQMPRVGAPQQTVFANVAPMDGDTRLMFLADWIDVPFVRGQVASIGDIVLAAGAAVAAYRLARQPRIRFRTYRV